MNNRLGNFGNKKCIYQFLAGFFVPIAIVGFGYWASKADSTSDALQESILAGSFFIGAVMLGSCFYAKDGTVNKAICIQSGVRSLYIAFMISLFIFILYCAIVPDKNWFWN